MLKIDCLWRRSRQSHGESKNAHAGMHTQARRHAGTQARRHARTHTPSRMHAYQSLQGSHAMSRAPSKRVEQDTKLYVVCKLHRRVIKFHNIPT